MPDQFAEHDRVEIYESRAGLSFLLAGGALLTLGSLFMIGACLGILLGFLGPPPTTGRQIIAPIFLSLIGVAGIIMFGLATIGSARRLFGARRPVLFLTQDGFKDTRISADWIPWSKIMSATDYRGQSLVLDVDPQFASRLRLSFASRFLSAANRILGYRGLWIVAFPLRNTSTRALLEIVRERI